MLSKGPLVVEALFGALMNRHFSLGLFVITSVTIAAIPHSSVAQGASLKDQLVGTWIYVSSTAKRDDGSNVPRPSLQGAVTYLPRTRLWPSPREDRSPTPARIRWTKAQKRST